MKMKPPSRRRSIHGRSARMSTRAVRIVNGQSDGVALLQIVGDFDVAGFI